MTAKTYLTPDTARKSASRGRESVTRNANTRKWSQEDDQIIRDNYQTVPYDTLGKMVGVSAETAKKRMYELGLSRQRLSSGGPKLTVTKKEREEYEESERRQTYLNRKW